MEQVRVEQGQDLIFALDIGTRSIIGVVGRAEEDRFHVLAIEKQEHEKRAMLDGQIEDIAQVARVVSCVARRLEERLHCSLNKVCIAAAGRALNTERGRFQLTLPGARRVDDDLIVQLEAGAVSQAEEALQRRGGEEQSQFFLVGYTVSQYLLDNYPMSTLKDHNGQRLEAEVVATFLPGEVVESLYSAMRMAQLEVVSLTLEPIAALNAAIPAQLRLLNLVLADIGAGTSDVAVCRDGAVVGYTMATVAGDEITEAIMKLLLVDFETAERLKAGLSQSQPLSYTDILGLDNEMLPEQLHGMLEPQIKLLAQELAARIIEVNDAAPSALFLAGGGSKLKGLCQMMAQVLEMDPKRVAVAGNNFKMSAFSEEYDINDPEYATPLGIAVSAGLGLINDSYRVRLNGRPAKLFRSGALKALDVLMMNGYTYTDLIGRTGQSLMVTIDGNRVVYRGEPATPSSLQINGKAVPPTTIVQTGDQIEFVPAISGRDAAKTLEDALESRDRALCAVVNTTPAQPEQQLRNGDIILTGVLLPKRTPPPVPVEVKQEPLPQKPQADRVFFLNGRELILPAKADAAPYYLMDLLDHCGLDFERVQSPVVLKVNGENSPFTQELKDGDEILIYCENQNPV